jgi:uncharacterized protein YjiS (DUF1127 family)
MKEARMMSLPSELGGVRRQPARRWLRAWIERRLLALLDWAERRQQRRRLLELDDHMLKDIGLSRADAMREAGLFWRAQNPPGRYSR